MRKKGKNPNKAGQDKLDILNQTRDRELMPRPAVFRDKKKYDRNAVKEENRKEMDRDE